MAFNFVHTVRNTMNKINNVWPSPQSAVYAVSVAHKNLCFSGPLNSCPIVTLVCNITSYQNANKNKSINFAYSVNDVLVFIVPTLYF